MNKIKILYALIGALLASLFAFASIVYTGNLMTDFGENMSFLLIYLSPLIVIVGIFMGIWYAKKYD